MTFSIPILVIAMIATVIAVPNAYADVSPVGCNVGNAVAVIPSLVKATEGDTITYDVRWDAGVGICDYDVNSMNFTFPDGSQAIEFHAPFTITSNSSITFPVPGSYSPTDDTDLNGNFWQAQVESDIIAHGVGDPPGNADQIGNTLAIHPAIIVDKAPHSKIAAGGILQVSANVTNTGDVTLNPVTATDTKAGALNCVASSLAPGVSTTCTGSFVANAAGSNTVTAFGTTQLGMVNATDTEQFTVQNPAIIVDKAPHSKIAAGGTLQVSANVTNTGDVTLNPVTATDTKAGALNCVASSLAPGVSTTCTGSFVANAAGSNTVTAFGTHQLGMVNATDTEQFTVQNPSMVVTKTCTVTNPGEITWLITVLNDGDVTLATLVSDSRHGPLFNGDILASQNFTTSIPENFAPGTYVDTVSATGTHQLGELTGSDTATCTIEAGGEGHTPGFYKNNADTWGAGSWVKEEPGDSFELVFSTTVVLNDKGKKTFTDPTLRDALDANGGGVNALARHCVAAKLNAEHPAITYPEPDPQVIIDECSAALNSGDDDLINDLKNQLDEWNNLGTDEVDQHWPN